MHTCGSLILKHFCWLAWVWYVGNEALLAFDSKDLSRCSQLFVFDCTKNSWSGRLEIDGFEAHDSDMIIQILSRGCWMNRLLHVCRTRDHIELPEPFLTKRWAGTGLRWYDTGQEHIITHSIFRNCGIRSNDTYVFDQYEKGDELGCVNDGSNSGCKGQSSVWLFNSHSDLNLPEIMQATKNITYQNCGRRFRFGSDEVESVSARQQNWFDADGTASGVGEPVFMGSGLEGATAWWHADDEGKNDLTFALRGNHKDPF